MVRTYEIRSTRRKLLIDRERNETENQCKKYLDSVRHPSGLGEYCD